MKRTPTLALILLTLAVSTGAALGETVRGKYRSTGPDPEYMFWPSSFEKVEITLVWLRPSVNLNLFVRCFDEIGSEYLVLVSEAAHDRIEHLEFGGYSGGVCRVSVFSVDQARNTTFLLNLQGSAEGSFAAVTSAGEDRLKSRSDRDR